MDAVRPHSTALNEFLSVDNLKDVMDIFRRFLKERHGMDIDTLPIDLKKTVFTAMQEIVQSNGAANATLKDLNHSTLRQVRQSVLKAADGVSRRSAQSQPLKREAALYGSRPVTTVETPTPEMSSRAEFQDVNVRLERIQAERDAMDPRAHVPAGLPSGINTQEVTAISNDEFEQRMLEFQRERETTTTLLPPPMDTDATKPIPTPALEATPPQSQPQPVEPLIVAASENTDIMQLTPMTGPSHRDTALLDIYKQNMMSQPKDLYSLGFPLSKTNASGESVQRASLLIPPPDPKNLSFMVRKKYMLINSSHRDWVNQKERYRYRVKFAYTSQLTSKEPFYDNNPIVPFTRTTNNPGIPNTSGWYDGNNAFHGAYNPTLPLGPVVGYEEVVMPIDTDANVQNTFKNITALQVTNVIVPMDIVINTATTSYNKSIFNYNFNLNFPYVLLQIDEFRDVYEGTDDTIRHSFCQLVYKKSYQSSNGRGYIVLAPVQCERKVFHPTPLSTLPSLGFSIIKPNGELMNKSRDGQTILKAEYEPFNPHYIKIVLNTYFDKNEYFKGDTVLIQRFVMYKLLGAQNQGSIQAFNAFMNRKEGHEIINIGDANDSGYYRAFYIQAPGVFNDASGRFDVDVGMIDNLVQFNSVYDVTGNPANGFILNMSLQNTISITIEQKQQDSAQVIQSTIV